MRTVWCLFSIENNYDQPSNNLETIWLVKPKFTDLQEAFNTLGGEVENDMLFRILDGKEQRIWNQDYRIQEVVVGKILE